LAVSDGLTDAAAAARAARAPLPAGETAGAAQATGMPLPDANEQGAAAAHAGVDHRSAFTHTVDAIQTVLTALILAFVFRAFFIEAFIIPTGSMAPTLHGAHAAQICPNCGWEYEVGASGSELDEMALPETVRCPNCHQEGPLLEPLASARAGDRILNARDH
jgi:signal peptidase I